MNIRVDLNYPINDGVEVVFRSPVDCSQVTGLKVYYPENGSMVAHEFAFADAHGNNVGDIDHLFAENVVVKVILDVTTGKAFVQNADTNAYLEGRFAELDERATNPDCHAEYFTITENGVLSVKDGAELPKYLVIPELVGEVAVDSIATGAFMGNTAIKTVVFPKTVKHIPESCFNESTLEKIINVDHVTSIGKNAFRASYLKSIKMPNLVSTAGSAFAYCACLTHADIGKVTQIQAGDFVKCRSLSRIQSDDLITSVGVGAFSNTPNLVNASFVQNLTSIGNGGFLQSGYDYDWQTLDDKGCSFGANATSLQINPTDFWSECTTYDCENPIPTLLCQDDPRWKTRPIGTSGVVWGDGCMLFCIMHIYGGLNNMSFSTVEEMEEEIERIAPGHLNNYSMNLRDIPMLVKPLGMTSTAYEPYNKENLQALYDALADGKYAIVVVPSNDTGSKMTGHTVVAYGLTKDGKLKIANSGYKYFLDRTVGCTYKLPYKTMCLPDSEQSVSFYIVEKTK